MTIDNKNQNDKINNELLEFYDIEYIFDNKPINRIKSEKINEDKSILLEKLKNKINYKN